MFDPALLSIIIIALGALTLFLIFVQLILQMKRNGSTHRSMESMQQHIEQLIHESFLKQQTERVEQIAGLREQLQQSLSEFRARFDERYTDVFRMLSETLHKLGTEQRQELMKTLLDTSKSINERMSVLTKTTEDQLQSIHMQVEKRLSDGFLQTNETFNRVIERLALIDAAQRKITELSGDIVSLQDILNDKRSRGAFGEVQLSALIHNMIPEQHVRFQHTLQNGKRADCLIFLPEPTGNIVIDAKFPLENYRIMLDNTVSEQDKAVAEKQFKIDVRKHIQDIAEKYIAPPETADSAVMFIPSESIFADIHGKHAELVVFAQQMRVWLVSPTTLMAILTTARAVLKDAATRQQVHEIQKHLRVLADDFSRFQLRMDNLAKRIAQAHADVEQVHISSKKISQRFNHIERTEFDALHEQAAVAAQVRNAQEAPSLIMGKVPVVEEEV